MEQQQSRHQPVKHRKFRKLSIEKREFRRRMKRAALSIQRNEAVGVDSVYSEMLQVSPTLFERLLKRFWEIVGLSKVIHSP